MATGKRDQRDFTLWKGAKPGEPSWPTPWGRGRPGWHLECSAMARTYLGPEFDIHCGGMDLVFPHHENEIAQSRAAGDGFARYWLHNGWVTMGGEKMSKSLGNVLAIPAMLQRVRAAELRYYLGSAHYRSMLEFSETALQDAVNAYVGIEEFLHRVRTRVGAVEPGRVDTAVRAALNDDLAVPTALAEVHRARAEGNRALDAGDHDAALAAGRRDPGDDGHPGLRPARRALGVARRDVGRAGRGRRAGAAELERRQQAREQRDWELADEIRDRLKDAGIEVTDTADGPQWSLGSRRKQMAGNSQRRGAIRKTGSKKGPTVGSGGQRRRGLEGRGRDAARAHAAQPSGRQARQGAGPRPARQAQRRRAPRRCSAATRCWNVCAPGFRRPRCTWRSGTKPTSGSPNLSRWQPIRASRSWRCRAPTWTG